MCEHIGGLSPHSLWAFLVIIATGHVRCPLLPPIDHGHSFYVRGEVVDEIADTGVECEGVTDGNSCHYVCDEGFRLTGPPALTCNYSGDWLGHVPQCQSKSIVLQTIC